MKLKYNDQYHSYWLDGVRCRSVSAMAKIPDDTYALEKWRARQIAVGMALDPTLVETAAAHYDDRNKIDQVAEEAMKIARSHEAAARGTAAHRITERVDLNEPLIDTPLAREIREAWLGALEVSRLQIVPEYVERLIVYPDDFVAGRFDRLVYNTRRRKLQVLDVKTGARAIQYPHSVAVQLAMYANAPLLVGRLDSQGYATDFTPMPENVDKKYGVVVHMPSDKVVEVHTVDIQAGWETVKKIIQPTMKWRDRRDLVAPLGSLLVNDGEASPDRVAWVKGRLSLLAMLDQANDVKRSVARQWPQGVSFKPPWSEADVSAIAVILGVVESEFEAPFAVSDPRKS